MKGRTPALHATMARAEDQAESASDDDRGRLNGSSDSDSDSGSGYNSGSSDGTEEDEDNEDVETVAAAAKKQRVHADIDEMRRMMSDMDAIKARLRQRFAAERQARLERLEREDREREVQDAACRKAEEETRRRQVEASVQTEPIVTQQQTNVSQQSACPPHLADGTVATAISATGATAALPAVDGDTGFADAAPNKPKPAGLRLYDLVKASGFGLSRRAPSPVRQADPPKVLPTRFSSEHVRVSPARRQQFYDEERQDSAAERDWSGGDSRLEDSVVGDGGDDYSGRRASHLSASSNPARSNLQRSTHEHSLPPSHHYDENSASVSNSLVSSDAGKQSAVFSDLIQRHDHKFNAAALLNTGKRPQSSTAKDDDKTDEQREMEAIQNLLFGRSVHR